MSIFKGPFDISGYSQSGTPYATYLSRSNRDGVFRVRRRIDSWLLRYPSEKRPELVTRLLSDNNVDHLSAFFELTLHSALRRIVDSVEVEPRLPHSSRRPDFLVMAADGSHIYVEATVVPGETSAEQAARTRLDTVFRALDSVTSSDFWLDVSHSGVLSTDISKKSLCRKVHNWLQTLVYDDVAAQRTTYVLKHEEAGLKLRIRPIPKRKARGTTSGRGIGMRGGPARFVNAAGPVASRIRDKAGRYGRLNAPYIVAINALGDYTDLEDIEDALFGTQAVAVRATSSGYEHRDIRNADGVWMSRGGPENRRVSAVLATIRLSPWSLASRETVLIRNPWTTHPLSDDALPFAQVRDVEGRLVRTKGVSLRRILRLPRTWPE